MNDIVRGLLKGNRNQVVGEMPVEKPDFQGAPHYFLKEITLAEFMKDYYPGLVEKLGNGAMPEGLEKIDDEKSVLLYNLGRILKVAENKMQDNIERKLGMTAYGILELDKLIGMTRNVKGIADMKYGNTARDYPQ